MTIPSKALSRAGQILYRELPEEYRYRDNNSEDEPGDLEAYLHGFGAFARPDPRDNGAGLCRCLC